MKRRLVPLILVLGVLCITACTKKQDVYDIDHENIVIDDNSVPHYEGVTTITIEAYINRVYIDLLGREPLTSERDQAVQELKDNDLSINARQNYITSIQILPEYYDRFGAIYMQSFLGDTDSIRVADAINLATVLVDQALQAGDQALAYYYDYERLKLVDLNEALYQYELGTITIQEYFSRLVYNSIYDDINMGSENFVIACFENILSRQPTETELESGVDMVNNNPAYLFLEDGNSKLDFIRIMMDSDAFYEGLVISIYNQLLARQPSSAEMGLATIDMQNGAATYQTIQRTVAASDEYAGF